MATFEDTHLHIPARGHIFHNEIDAEAFSIDNFKFGDASTYGTWTWLGDHSIENLPSFETEGGEVTFKHTWDRPNQRATRTPKSITATFNSVNIGRETMELGFPGGEYDLTTNSYGVPSAEVTGKRSLLVVTEDGTDISAVQFYNTEVSGSFPLYDAEEFLEVPLNVTILNSAVHNMPWRIFFPRPYTAPVTP